MGDNGTMTHGHFVLPVCHGMVWHCHLIRMGFGIGIGIGIGIIVRHCGVRKPTPNELGFSLPLEKTLLQQPGFLILAFSSCDACRELFIMR